MKEGGRGFKIPPYKVWKNILTYHEVNDDGENQIRKESKRNKISHYLGDEKGRNSIVSTSIFMTVSKKMKFLFYVHITSRFSAHINKAFCWMNS